MFKLCVMSRGQASLIIAVVIMIVLLISFYLIFNTHLLMARDNDTKQWELGLEAACFDPTVQAPNFTIQDIHFVGCGGIL